MGERISLINNTTELEVVFPTLEDALDAVVQGVVGDNDRWDVVRIPDGSGWAGIVAEGTGYCDHVADT